MKYYDYKDLAVIAPMIISTVLMTVAVVGYINNPVNDIRTSMGSMRTDISLLQQEQKQITDSHIEYSQNEASRDKKIDDLIIKLNGLIGSLKFSGIIK